MNDIRSVLIAQAKSKGVCAEGLRRMSECVSLEGLIEYYLSNPDWCMERGFPSLAVLRESFSDICERGVYVGREFDGDVLNGCQVYVLHECSGTVRTGLNVESRVIPMFYVGNGCRIRLEGMGGERESGAGRSVVPVYAFGDNVVSTVGDGSVEFRVYREGLI